MKGFILKVDPQACSGRSRQNVERVLSQENLTKNEIFVHFYSNLEILTGFRKPYDPVWIRHCRRITFSVKASFISGVFQGYVASNFVKNLDVKKHPKFEGFDHKSHPKPFKAMFPRSGFFASL